MSLIKKAEIFANKHCGRRPDGQIDDKDNWDWWFRLYLRIVEYELHKSQQYRVLLNYASETGLIECGAIDFVYEHPNIHNERGAICISGKELTELYVSVIQETF